MACELIITEKPQAAAKIAEALADNKPIKESINKVPYFRIKRKGRQIVVGCAVGHLYTVGEKAKGKWTYPVFETQWVPTSKVQKGSSYTTKYSAALRKLCKEATMLTVACDYDIEGEVIGYNVVKHICKKKDASRMKFSTLTRSELQRSYDNKEKSLDWGQVHAGVTRHVLDWYYGINLSRALTIAVKNAGLFKILSSGRVQGPALKIIVDREKEIAAFKPEPFWQIELDGMLKKETIVAWHEKDKFWDKKDAAGVMRRTKGHDGNISKVDKKQFQQSPPTPFDLTTLQTEAYRSIRIQPKKTLELAQELYIAGLISYPRTSSQKLPKSIGFKRLLEKLSNNKQYNALCNKLLAIPSLNPNEGKKTDPAHPAIYPTGNSAELSGPKAKVYDIIVRRFMACFAEPAKRETVSLTITVNSENFIAKGTRTIYPGWHEFYGPHLKLEEQTMPSAQEGDHVKVKEIKLHDKETQPPKRYTPASIIKELENRSLGTKATRAAIVDALFERGYAQDTSIKATPLGIHTCDTLHKYSPQILDEELTRHFEEEMDKIRENKIKPNNVLDEAKDSLTQILENLRSHEKAIGKELAGSLAQTRDELNHVGKCPTCKDGRLMIRSGRFGKFIACDKYPKCKVTFKLPAGRFKVTDKLCETCSYPMITIFKGKRPQTLCINDKCPGKQNGTKEATELKNGKVEKECPKCKNPLVVRKSIYGEFLGCSNFPKCRYTERINDGPLKEDFK